MNETSISLTKQIDNNICDSESDAKEFATAIVSNQIIQKIYLQSIVLAFFESKIHNDSI